MKIVHRRPAVISALALVASSIVLIAHSQAASADTGESDLRRCALQVANTPKVVRSPDGTAIDAGNLTGDPSGVSSRSATPAHLEYGGSAFTVWDEADSGTADFLGSNASFAGLDTGTPDNPTTTLDGRWAVHPDVPNATQKYYAARSSDDGKTWSAPITTSGESGTFPVQLRDGRQLKLAFKSSTENDYLGQITDSTGNSTSAQNIRVRFPDIIGQEHSPLAWTRVAGDPIQRSDGSVLVALYGADKANPSHWIVALTVGQPAPGTADWEFKALRPDVAQPLSVTNRPVTLGASRTGSNFSEVGMLERPDGSIMAIIRNLVVGESSGSDVLQHTTSIDGGLTWSTLNDVTGQLSGWNGNGSPLPTTASNGLPGIMPRLELLGNSMIVLSSGKPDNWISYSTTGNAGGWVGQYTYRNCPTTMVTPSRSYYTGDDADQWRYGSSGNTAVVPVDTNRIVQFGDNCHSYHWGCVRTSKTFDPQSEQSPYTTDLTSRIWGRRIDVLSPHTGKLDLHGLVQSGQASVTGNMNWASALHPRTGLKGAFDGSTSYWSSAVATGTAGRVELDLGRSYTLERFGLSLRPQLPASAKVSISQDRSTWTEIGGLTDQRTRALVYKNIAPIDGRYVRVDVPTVADCESEIGSSCAFLNEIELFTSVIGFENDAWGNLPRDADPASAAYQAWVTSSDSAKGSSQSLLLKDASTSYPAEISFKTPSSAAGTLAFEAKPVAWAATAAGFTTAFYSGAAKSAQVTIFKDGTINYLKPDGTFQRLGSQTIPLNQWSKFRFTWNNGSLELNVGNESAGIIPLTPGATSIDRYKFSSAGTAPTGDTIYIDNIEGD